MSRGLGQVQRGLLLALARIEITEYEAAAAAQQPYRPPQPVAVEWLVFNAARHELQDYLEPRLRAHQERRDYNSMEAAIARQDTTHVSLLVAARRAMTGHYTNPRRHYATPETLERWDRRYLLEKLLTPSRALAALRQRGLIARLDWKRGVVMLTSKGLAEACKLGLAGSDIVDVDRLAVLLAEQEQRRDEQERRFAEQLREDRLRYERAG